MQIAMKVKIALLAGGIVLLLGNVFIMYKNTDTEWRRYQTTYLKMAQEKATDPQMKEILAARTPRIEQITVTGFGKERVDRCITCHMGVDDPKFADAPQPFKTHPKVPGNHAYRTYGCTMCHMGNGRGLAVADAHGTTSYWTEPLVKGALLEATCAKCHPAPYLDDMPTLRKGYDLFHRKACYGCHRIEGRSDGKLGPDLTRVGAKWPVEYLRESITYPKANAPESIMPTLDVTPDELEALTVYLKSLNGENLVQGPVTHFQSVKMWKESKPGEVPVTVESGKQVYDSMSCAACHTINGVGGKIGPDLSVYGKIRTPEYMMQHHLNPRSVIGGSVMPDFNYSASELKALALYLGSLTELKADNEKVFAPVASAQTK